MELISKKLLNFKGSGFELLMMQIQFEFFLNYKANQIRMFFNKYFRTYLNFKKQ